MVGEQPSGLVQAMVDRVAPVDPNPTRGEAIEVLEKLLAQVRAGEVIYVFATGITPDDNLQFFAAQSRPISQLRVLGAIQLGLVAVQGQTK